MAKKQTQEPGEPGQDHRKKPNPGADNLKPPWPKGVSGNPGGRPKGRSIIKILRRLMGEPATILVKPDLSKLTVAEFLAIQGLVQAGKGKSAYFREILGQLYGRPALRIEHKTVDGQDDPVPPEVAAAGLRAMIEAAERRGHEQQESG